MHVAQLALANEENATDWGPKVGTIAPILEAEDHEGITQTFDSLKGSKGLLLVFNRSVDW